MVICIRIVGYYWLLVFCVFKIRWLNITDKFDAEFWMVVMKNVFHKMSWIMGYLKLYWRQCEYGNTFVVISILGCLIARNEVVSEEIAYEIYKVYNRDTRTGAPFANIEWLRLGHG